MTECPLKMPWCMSWNYCTESAGKVDCVGSPLSNLITGDYGPLDFKANISRNGSRVMSPTPMNVIRKTVSAEKCIK